MKLRNIFRRKENPTWGSILALIGGGDVVWTPKNYYDLSKAGYQNCSTVFACVALIARTASQIDWYVQSTNAKGDTEEIENHPLDQLLDWPNEYESGQRFIEKVIAHLLLAGNSYVLKVGVGTQPPKFLYALRPDRMKIRPGNKAQLVGGYQYDPGNNPVNFQPEEILHLLEFHPTDDFYGLSRLEVAAQSIDISNLSQAWNAKLLQNDMRPPGAIKTLSPLTTDQYERLRNLLKSKYQGATNAGMPLLFEGGMEWQQLSIPPKDMDWLDAEKFNLRRICTVFGVASELLGDSENKTYSNIQEARRALYTETVLPIMDLMKAEFNKWLAPLYGEGIELTYDKDSIEALQENNAEKYAYLSTADFLTVNEKRVAAGFDEVEGGDVVLVPISSIPLEQATAEPEPVPDALAQFAGGGNGEDGVDEEEDQEAGPKKLSAKGIWADSTRREVLWKAFETRVRTREKSFVEIAKGYIKGQAERVKARAAVINDLTNASATQLFDAGEETAKFVKTFGTWYRDHFVRAGNAGMQAAKGEIFDDAEFKADNPRTSWVFNMTPEQERRLKKMIFDSGTIVNATTISLIYDELLGAQGTNMTVAEFTRAIYDKIDGFSHSRARLWARTESAKVDNCGNVEGYKQTEFVNMKGWLCSMIPTSRDTHIAADRQEAPLDEAFNIGGEMLMYPGDPVGTPGETCNCLCSTYPIVGEM